MSPIDFDAHRLLTIISGVHRRPRSWSWLHAQPAAIMWPFSQLFDRYRANHETLSSHFLLWCGATSQILRRSALPDLPICWDG
jgi:hypothetical protein